MHSQSDDVTELRAKFEAPTQKSKPTPLYWWSGSDLDIERMIWHLDLLASKGVGGTVICYAHKPDGSIDHGNPTPYSDVWWSLLKQFVDESAKRGLTAGICDYQVIGTVLLNAADKTQGLNGGNLRNYSESVEGPATITRPLDGKKVLSRRLVSEDGLRLLDASQVEQDGVTWAVPSGRWHLSTVTVEPGQIYLFESRFDPLHPSAGSSVIDLFFNRFKQELGDHLGTTFTTFFQDELELGISTPMWNDLVGLALKSSGFEPLDAVHALWHGSSDTTMRIRAAFRDTVVNLLQENFFKPIFEWHERHNTDFVMDQLSRGDLALGHEHYSDFMETMAWYQGPGNDDPDLTGPRNVSAFRVSASIAHLNNRRLVTNEAFHSSGWGVTPQMIIKGLNIDFAAGANQVVLHGLDYSLESGWWEWASPDFHFRQPWWEHSEPLWLYLSRVSEMLQAGNLATEIAVLDATPELDFFRESEAPRQTSKLLEELSFRGLGVDLVPQSYLSGSYQTREGGVTFIEARNARYSVLIVPNLKLVRAEALQSIQEFVNNGGLVINLGQVPLRTEERVLGVDDFVGWHLAPNVDDLVADLHTNFAPELVIKTRDTKILQTHRAIGATHLYFIVNPNDTAVELDLAIRGTNALELWDPWTALSLSLASDIGQIGLGATYRSIRLELKPGESAMILQSPEFDEAKKASPVTETHVEKLDQDWLVRFENVLDNRYFDYVLDTPDLPIATYHLEYSKRHWGPWTNVLADHGTKFRVAGPFSESESVAVQEVFGGDSGTNEALASLSWRDYKISQTSGIPKDQYLMDRMTGPHGLKGVPAEFLDPVSVDANPAPGTYYYFYSTVESTGGVEVLKDTGRAEHRIWVNGELVISRNEIPAAHFPPWNLRNMSSDCLETDVMLKPGTNDVVVCVKISHDQPSRVSAVVGGTPPIHPKSARMIWWQGTSPALSFAVSDVTNEGWLRVQIPPGARTAFIPTRALVSCPDGQRVTAANGGYQVGVMSCTGYLVFKLTWIDSPLGVLDEGALSGPITWELSEGKTDLQHWDRLGLRDFSGIGTYEYRYNLQEPAPQKVALRLFDLQGSARVFVNGEHAGYVLSENGEVSIGEHLVLGDNRIQIESANTLENLFSRLPSPYSIMQKPGGGFSRVELSFYELK